MDRTKKRKAFEDLSTALSFADGVNRGMCVNGRLFAVLEGDELAVRLRPDRVQELVRETAAVEYSGEGFAPGHWLLIGDVSEWPELADESHRYTSGLEHFV